MLTQELLEKVGAEPPTLPDLPTTRLVTVQVNIETKTHRRQQMVTRRVFNAQLATTMFKLGKRGRFTDVHSNEFQEDKINSSDLSQLVAFGLLCKGTRDNRWTLGNAGLNFVHGYSWLYEQCYSAEGFPFAWGGFCKRLTEWRHHVVIVNG